jgi:hypothetical protein
LLATVVVLAAVVVLAVVTFEYQIIDLYNCIIKHVYITIRTPPGAIMGRRTDWCVSEEKWRWFDLAAGR